MAAASRAGRPPCSHKFVDSKVCLRCGKTPMQIRLDDSAREAAELDACDVHSEPPATPRERPPTRRTRP
jgi:hypothetical protein